MFYSISERIVKGTGIEPIEGGIYLQCKLLFYYSTQLCIVLLWEKLRYKYIFLSNIALINFYMNLNSLHDPEKLTHLQLTFFQLFAQAFKN